MDPENRVSAHNLHVPVLDIERLMVGIDPLAITLSEIIVKFGWGQVGYSGDAQSGGGNGGDSVIGEGVGGRLWAMQAGERLDVLQE